MNRILLHESNNNLLITFGELPGVQFKITKSIGRGASCVVYHAVGSDDTEHLLKEYYPKHLELLRDGDGKLVVPEDKQEVFAQGLLRFRKGCEQQKTIRLSNEGLKNFICNVQGYYAANNTEYIDMTCFSGQTYDHVQEKSVYNLMLRMRTLAQVVGNYHATGLLHLDIKPENIYVRPENETIEDVMLFDFDSVTPMSDVRTAKALSCTKTWAAPEQLLSEKRKSICPATDLFAIGEIIFVQLFGRHSNSAERRSFVTKYNYDYNAAIFKDMNPKVFPLLDDLLCHTICGVVGRRYQSAGDLIAKLDEIIKIANLESPYLKSSLPAVQDFFVGRENEIEEIHHKLSENRTLFLNGIGGIGKSELAKRYALKYKDDYDAIIFAPYVSDVNMLLQDDAAIPLYNFAPYPEEKPEEYCARKLRKLQELCNERTLFIVDNLDRKDDPDLNKLLDLECKLLITTRMDFTDYGYGQQLYLDALCSRNSILEIFHKHYTKPLTEEETACVEQIIDLVAGHTMTVELLAKQMMAGRIKPDKMLAKLQESGISESGEEKVRSGKDGVLSAQSTYDHIQTLFDLSDLDEEERYILANLSLMPYTGISTEVFFNWCELKDYNALNNLTNTGLIQVAGVDNISLHPVIAENVSNISSVVPDVYRRMLNNVKEWVSDKNLRSLTSIERKYRADLVLYIAHKLLSFNVVTEEVAAFLNRVPTVFWKYGKLRFAISCRDKALQIRLQLLGELNSDTATSYFNLGRMYKEVGEYETAEDKYKKSLEIRQSLFGEDHEDTASAYNALGVLYKEREIFDIAEEYELKALRIREKLLGEKDEDVASSYNCLAVLYKELQKYEKAEQFHFQALEVRRFLFGETHEDVATSYNNLGTLYKEWGKLCEAEVCLLKALEVRRHVFGDMHSCTADTYAILGDLYRKREEFGSAKTSYQKALEIRTILLGENHKKTIRMSKRIANLPQGPTQFTMRQNQVQTATQRILEACTLDKSKHYSKERCPDQLVAKVRISKAIDGSVSVEYINCCETKNQKNFDAITEKTVYKRENIATVMTKNEFPRIVMILESPHRDEFNPTNLSKPINGPAYGISGDNINKYLPDALLSIAEEFAIEAGNIEYEIALVNAIQYQCSMGEKTNKYRDRVFWECWQHKDVRADFCDRVKAAIGSHMTKSIVINCCTTGNLVRSNHALVNIALEDMGLSFFESAHPFGWIDENKRQISRHTR